MALNGRVDRDGTAPSGGAQGVPQECPDAERLAEYAEGLLDPAARAAIEAHLVTCADCRFAVVETMAFLAAEAAEASGEVAPGTVSRTAPGVALEVAHEDTAPKPGAEGDVSSSSTSAPARVVPFRRRVWVTGVGAGLAAAAALVLIVRLAEIPWLPAWLGGQPFGELVAALDSQRVRPVEGRLMLASAELAYKPAPSPTRGSSDRLGRGWSPEVDIATANIGRFAEGATSARKRAALGIALIVEGDLDRAILELEAAAQELSTDQPTISNLSAAYLARARWFDRREDWQKALDAADRAIALDPAAIEPHFNRALAVEGLGQTDAAAKAWTDYTARDRDSGWGREADERRRTLLTHQP